jgi:hypothetical protein
VICSVSCKVKFPSKLAEPGSVNSSSVARSVLATFQTGSESEVHIKEYIARDEILSTDLTDARRSER